MASVKTAVEGNVLPELIAGFEKTSRYRVELTPGESVYTWAREGKADLVVSHYGHREAEDFVLADPLLQRLMVSVVVKPSRVPGANAEGARALQAHLLAPSTQALIRSIRYPGDKRAWLGARRTKQPDGHPAEALAPRIVLHGYCGY